MKTFRELAVGSALLAAVAVTPALAGVGVGGDPFFPKAGNEGYEVSDYNLAIDYTPVSNRLVGTARIEATANSTVERFNLDLRAALEVSSVLVDGAPAAHYRQSSQELAIRAASPILGGSGFSVEVDYAGEPKPVIDPDGSSEGWIRTDDGSFVVGEPQGSPSWFPVNDTPRDKAAFTISITVPDGLVGIGNGLLQSRTSEAGKETFVWRQEEPMAPYLATASTGEFELTVGKAAGLPYYEAIDPRADGRGSGLPQTGAMIRYLSKRFGEYPFSSFGAIVDHEPGVSYALETQSIPIYPGTPDTALVVHELAHQWFGNAVTLKRWPDIWLHEGLATWTEWDWSEQTGGPTRRQIYRDLYRDFSAEDDAFWNPPSAAIDDPADLFATSTYNRGGMTIEALVQRIGERKVIEILRRFYADNRYGNVNTRDFTTLAAEVSGENLRGFFSDWLYEAGKPKGYGVSDAE